MLNKVEGPIWAALGMGISFLSYQTGIGVFTEPGAGFVALATGLFLVVIGAFMSFTRRRAPGRQGGPGKPGTFFGRFFRLAYMLSLLVLYGVFLEPLGYLIATFLLMYGLFFHPEGRRFGFPLFASLISVAVTYTVFEVWLKTQLPRGICPWW